MTAEKELVDAALRHRETTVLISLTAVSAIDLVAQLQLALRHPRNVGLSAEAARQFVDGLVAHLERIDPAFAYLRRGDDPAFDVPFDPCGGDA